jgi:hypothetical protein
MFKRVTLFVLNLIIGAVVVANGFAARDVFAQSTQNRSATRGRTAGAATQRPGLPAAEAIVTLNEQFMNSLLDAIFTNLKAPSYPISLSHDGSKSRPNQSNALAPSKSNDSTSAPSSSSSSLCASVVVLEREMNGVKTAVHFENGRIVAPVAFSGSYNTGLLGCLRFQGWADTNITLEFDREQQTLNARVSVMDVTLDGLPTLASGVVIGMVQNAVDQRLNPVEILRTEHLSARVPISAAGGALRLRARELRPEIVPGALRLHIIYEFVRAE